MGPTTPGPLDTDDEGETLTKALKIRENPLRAGASDLTHHHVRMNFWISSVHGDIAEERDSLFLDILQERTTLSAVEHLGKSPHMPKQKTDLLQGTLDLLILRALQLGPMHGFGVSILIRQMSNEVLQVEQGSLYPALYRLEQQGWISSEWGVSDNNRKAKFYRLTPAGRKQLLEEREAWDRLSTAINLVLKAT
jgi:PadR family transcriptional regulator, regulatory protein PadR